MVKIIFSRHARRRGKLYNISELTIIEIVAKMNLTIGNHEILQNVSELEHPLKIVVVVGADIITVITSYPLKKRREK